MMMPQTDSSAADVDSETSPITTLLDLPDDALFALTACLPSVRDIAALACVSTRFRSVCRAAPVKIHLDAAVRTTTDLRSTAPAEATNAARTALTCAAHSFPGTAELHLSGLPLSNDDIADALQQLPNIALLSLAGCKKLTKEAVTTVTASSNLRAIDLQRCFQQLPDALTTLLAAAAEPLSHLSTVALSHLDLSNWPPSFGISDVNTTSCCMTISTSAIGKLKILALHNCTKLTAQGLHTIVAACPLLELLCLGGTSFALAEGYDARHSNSAGLCSDCGGSGSGGYYFDDKDAFDTHNDYSQQQQQLRREVAAIAASSSAATSAAMPAYSSWLQATAVELTLAVTRLRHLCALEITFCAPGLSPVLRRTLDADCVTAARGVAAPQLAMWDACDAASTASMLRFKSQFPVTSTDNNRLSASDVELALQAIVRCSSPGRITALHSAAAAADDNRRNKGKANSNNNNEEEDKEKCVRHVDDLLALGADPSARDRGGASALFTACEAGHAHVAARLLTAGADVMTRNAANENSLYIAALRGHSDVIEVLLRFCQTHNIDWTNPRHYGDGWSPLHASAVAGRVGIAAQLLSAAGSSAPALVCASNRYGQTCVHVAARKGSPALLTVLLAAGGKESVSLADVDGRTAADVARRNGNAGAWRLLTGKGCAAAVAAASAARHKGTTPTLEKSPKQTMCEKSAGGQRRWVGRRLQQCQQRQSSN